MQRTIMSFLGAAVLCLLAVGDFRGAAEAAVVPVSRANVEGNIADGDETTKTLQEIIDDDDTYVGDRDVLDFAPGEYEDAGELLVTRPLTLRKAPGSVGDVKFTGKVMINIKSDDVVVEGLTFMDVTVPDIVTVKVDRDAETSGDQPLLYGFPGKTLADFLDETISTFTFDESVGLWCSFDEDDEVYSGPIVEHTDDSGGDDDACYYLPYNDELWVTVASSDANNGKIANMETGAPVSYFTPYNARRTPTPAERAADPNRPRFDYIDVDYINIVDEGITSTVAKNGLGTIWVDAYAPDGACETHDARPVEVAEITGVVIRNNTFNGTEVAAVRGGDQGPPGRLPAARPNSRIYAYCQTEIDVVANTFMNVGGTGGFAKDSNGKLFTDDDGNKIAEVGNREPAIDLGKVVRAEITDNTIDGGTWDAVVLARTPEGARINIRNNLITNTILDGIKITGVGAFDAESETAITVMGNRVTGTSMNRYITLYNSWSAPFNLQGENNYLDELPGCFSGLLGSASLDSPEVKAANRLLAPEIWRSPKPEFTFSAAGAPASNLDEDSTSGYGNLKYYIDTAGYDYYDQYGAVDAVGYTALVRISAAACHTSRIKVDRQEGVSIIGNDLGYEPDLSGITPAGSPGYGLVVIGTGTTLAAFSGNNIDHFGQASVLSVTGKAIPTNGNYLGPTLRVQTGEEISFAAADASESEPLAGTADAPRGPRDSMVDPDRTGPMLTGAEVNEAGTVLTLTYNENLDGTSTPSAGDFVITIRKQAAVGRSLVTSPTDVAVDGMRIVLTLPAGVEIEAGDVITVTYSGGGIRDAAGNVAAAITTTSQTVTNNVGRGSDTGPGTAAGGGTGGCVLASDAGNGTYAGMLLPLMFAGLAFGMRRLGRKGL